MPDEMYTRPARPIKHDNYDLRDRFFRIPAFALAPINKYLTDRERRLFLYYAGSADGFAPSEKETAYQTQIDRRKIYTVRKQLADKRFIYYIVDRDRADPTVHIRWDNIRSMASRMHEEYYQQDNDHNAKSSEADKQKGLMYPANLAGIIDKVPKERTFLPTIRQLNQKGFGHQESAPYLTESNKRFIKAFEELNIEEARSIINIWFKEQEHQEEPLPF